MKQNNIVLAIVVYDNSLCFIFGKKKYKKPYQIINYTTFCSAAYQVHDGILFNYSLIKNELLTYIKTHKLYPSFITIIVDNKQLSQNFIVASQPIRYMSDRIDDFNYKIQPIHTHYIGPCDEIDHLLCRCTMTNYALLQYQLLIMPLHIPILNIGCPMHSLLYAYQGYKGTTFRLSELVQDIIKHDTNMDTFFTNDMLHRLIPNVFFQNSIDKKALLLSYGSIMYQESLYG
ncbi:hypothetical protein EKK58_03975 [Candidatus Dependentiae bacterium]|nr:MAG: hypothetical protein EKK58_03975 [Candidatus Dependentiae bacterium]